MERFSRITTTLLLLVLGISIQAQNPKGLKINENSGFQNGRKFTADDISEIQIKGETFSDEDVNNAGKFADPINERTMACATAFNLVCPYNTNNGQRGCMFDVFATNTVTISCFDANIYSGTTANYQIYYRPGTFVGFENNSAAWTLLGTANAVTSLGNNMPTPLPIPIGVTIPAGQRFSFYVTNDFGGGTSYTDGAAVGNFLAGDANITAFEGVGKSYPFGLTFTVRKFNGTIYYNLGGVFDGNEAKISANAEENGLKIDWESPKTQEFQKIELEYSQNAGEFNAIAQLDPQIGSGSVFHLPKGKENWYRLRMTDLNGETMFSNIAKYSVQTTEPFKIIGLAPNPSTEDVKVQFVNYEDAPLNIQLLDAMGKIVFSAQYERGESSLHLPMKSLDAGIYLLQMDCKGKRESRRIIHQ